MEVCWVGDEAGYEDWGRVGVLVVVGDWLLEEGLKVLGSVEASNFLLV